MTPASPTRVLVVDDSAVVRKLLSDGLRQEPGVEVVGGAADPYAARDMILRHKPDLMTLDLEMPRMDGLTFLSKLMAHHPVPTIIISSLTQSGSAASVEALRLGAIDVIAKPGGPQSVGEVIERLRQRVRAFRASGGVRLTRRDETGSSSTVTGPSSVSIETARRARGVLAIGASTGGPQAIEAVLSRLPDGLPPIVIAQHMPAGFTQMFAERLNGVCPMRVVEARGGEVLERGTAYIAPGGSHLTVEQRGVALYARLDQSPPEHFQRPAVDVLFRSLARLSAVPRVAMLLTGMGVDGADGMVALRASGAVTIAEAEESCIVFGMPGAAIARGGAMHVSPLLRIPHVALESLGALVRAA